MSRKTLYLLLAVLGLLIPYSQFLPWLIQNGPNYHLFLSELTANRISTFFVADVLLSAITLIAFIRTESKKTKIPHAWTVTAGLCLVGVSFALPLYLYLRERT